MARGRTLQQLTTALRDELGRSNDVNVGVSDLDGLRRTLRRVQENLYDEYDWPHLRQTVDLDMVAGQYRYDVPSEFNYERIEEVVCRHNGITHGVERGIEFADFDNFDPAANERYDPVLKWDIRWTGTAEQIEVWPVPATATLLRIKGIRQLRAMVSVSDVCDLDERLIVLFAAAELLGRSKAPDAGAKQQQAQQLLARLKGRSQGAARQVRFGMGDGDRQKPFSAVVRVSG